mmetsp:Transcript_1479/g.4200  ORF Transcript_1479/g.4200 Transcript_1479/m.4200 type:complete len:259 (+) Transcript_1479:2279-3055(+)
MSFSNTQQGLQDPEAMSSVTQLIDTYVRTTSSTASPPGNLSPDVLSLDVGPVQVGKAMEHSLLLGLDDEGSSSGDGPSYIASRVHQRLESMCAPRSRAANGSGVAPLRRRATGSEYALPGGGQAPFPQRPPQDFLSIESLGTEPPQDFLSIESLGTEMRGIMDMVAENSPVIESSFVILLGATHKLLDSQGWKYWTQLPQRSPEHFWHLSSLPYGYLIGERYSQWLLAYYGEIFGIHIILKKPFNGSYLRVHGPNGTM